MPEQRLEAFWRGRLVEWFRRLRKRELELQRYADAFNAEGDTLIAELVAENSENRTATEKSTSATRATSWERGSVSRLKRRRESPLTVRNVLMKRPNEKRSKKQGRRRDCALSGRAK